MSFVTHQISSSGVAIININNPPVNALSARLVNPLIETFQSLSRQNEVKAFILRSDNKDIFVSGADIKEFGTDSGKGIQKFVPFLDELERSNKPVIMVIEGSALGGGCELALAGHYRLAGPKAVLGLVELQLGIIPGAAGTQRMPRVVGPVKATEYMLASTTLRGKQLLESGLVDAIHIQGNILEQAEKVALELARNPSQLRRASQLTDKIDLQRDIPQIKKILQGLERSGKARNQIHFQKCVEAIIVGLEQGYEAGLKVEAKNFMEVLTSTQASGLMNVFFASRNSSKIPGITDQGFKIPPLKKIAVLGGGTMGSGIAAWLLSFGCEVWLKEIDEKAGELAKSRVFSNFESRLKSGRITQQQIDAMASKFKIVTTYNNFDQLDCVIEAIFEDIPLKQKTFQDLEKVTRKDCILASNTSTIDIDVIANNSPLSNRIIGLHFFAPSFIMPLVEIIPGKETSKEVINAMVVLVKNFKKTPVVVGNCAGFLVNRIFGLSQPVVQFLLNHGVDPNKIDKAVESFGLAIGPLKVTDMSGIDIVHHVGNLLRTAYPDRYPSPVKGSITEIMMNAKRLGQKTGKGYYKYEGRAAVSDPEIIPLINEARKNAGTSSENLNLSDEEIVRMIYYPVVDEGLRCLETKIASRTTDIDICSVLGMGFPAYRGGIMHWAKTEGFSKVKQSLQQWYTQYGLSTFKPCDSKYYGQSTRTAVASVSSSSSEEENISVEGFKASASFEDIRRQIKQQPELKKIGVVFGFTITSGKNSQQWIVDLKEGKVSLGSKNTDCSLTMSDNDFVSLLAGDLDPLSAFFQQRIKVDKGLPLVMKLQQLQKKKSKL